MQQIIIVGGFHEIIELCEDAGREVIGILDIVDDSSYMEYPILGKDENADRILKNYPDVQLIFSPDLPRVRKKLHLDVYKNHINKITTIIHPSATISRRATLGKGVVIHNHVNISSKVTVGDFVRCNTYANIMHDTAVGDYSTIAPNAVILGNCILQEAAYIGANATVLPGIVIGEAAMVGAGSVVTRNVIAHTIVKGVPAILHKPNSN